MVTLLAVVKMCWALKIPAFAGLNNTLRQEAQLGQKKKVLIEKSFWVL